MNGDHVCWIKTARVNYQGLADQKVFNTTVKSGTELGAVFAPTWEMVMKSKRGEMDWEEYTRRYTDLMRKRYQANKEAFLEILSYEKPVVTCYCQDTHQTSKHCHRYILVDILEKVACHEGIKFNYSGEARN